MYLRKKKFSSDIILHFPLITIPQYFQKNFKHNSVLSYNNITSHLYDENVT